MSNEMDTLLNAYSQNPDFGKDTDMRDIRLDEYEKSVLLTHAQEALIKAYFQNNTANDGNGFDDSERRQMDYSTLITNNGLGSDPLSDVASVFDEGALAFAFPSNVLFVLNERVLVKNAGATTEEYVVIPINYNDYDRLQSKPYTKPLKKQAWRMLNNGTYTGVTGTRKFVEIILRDELSDGESAIYKVRYVRRPRPILTEDFTGMDLSFAGDTEEAAVTGPQDCELDPIMHRDIVNEAVRLAIASRGSQPTTTTRSNSQ